MGIGKEEEEKAVPMGSIERFFFFEVRKYCHDVAIDRMVLGVGFVV
jgi:hypothetical protein